MKHAHSLTKNIFAYFLVFMSTAYFTLLGHGFGTHTLVHMADNSIEEIGMLCRRVLDKKLAVISYDAEAATLINAPILRCGTSTTHRYVQFCFNGSLTRESTSRIICTPTQEFYSPISHTWVPAYQLQAGDALLCKQGIKTIADIAYVKQSLEIYTLQIQNTHTFFVGYHGALTHNMVIPAALGMGFSIPFGSAAGSTAGSFFGPITLVAGAVLGSAIGAFVSIVQSDSIPSYKVNLGNTHYIDNFIHQRGGSDAGGNTISQQGSNFISPMPDGPKKDDDKDKHHIADSFNGAKDLADQLAEDAKKRGWENPDMPPKNDPQKLNHVFPKEKNGHDLYSDTAYQEMLDLVKDPQNFLGKDKYGNQWFEKICQNGKQKWAKAYGKDVISGGTNPTSHPYDPEFGIIKPGSPSHRHVVAREAKKTIQDIS